MAAYEIEIILNRQLADCLSIPVFITDTDGNLIFYNEHAEEVLGKRFEETGEIRPASNGRYENDRQTPSLFCRLPDRVG